MEMTAQRRVIDQLVAGSSSGVPNRWSNRAATTTPIQTSFAPYFVNPPKEAFIYPTHCLPHSYTSNIHINLPHTQVPQKIIHLLDH